MCICPLHRSFMATYPSLAVCVYLVRLLLCTHTSSFSFSDAVRVYNQPGYFTYAPLPSAISGKTLVFEQGHSFFARLLSPLAGKVFPSVRHHITNCVFLIDSFFLSSWFTNQRFFSLARQFPLACQLFLNGSFHYLPSFNFSFYCYWHLNPPMVSLALVMGRMMSATDSPSGWFSS